MYSPTIIILSVVLGFLTCSDANMHTDRSAETPSDVVRQYVSFAQAGEFDKVGPLVISSLTGKPETPKASETTDMYTSPEIKKDASKTKNTGGYTVAPDPGAAAEGTLDWVNDFARSIHDEKLSLRSVRKESANETEARVEIVLGNEKTVNLLGWVFLLRKIDDKWRIYNITTPGGVTEPLR